MNAREDGAYFEWWNAYGEMADIDVEYPAYRAGKAYQQKQNSAELAALRSQLATFTAEREAMVIVCAKAAAHIIALHNKIKPTQSDEKIVKLIDNAVLNGGKG